MKLIYGIKNKYGSYEAFYFDEIHAKEFCLFHYGRDWNSQYKIERLKVY